GIVRVSAKTGEGMDDLLARELGAQETPCVRVLNKCDRFVDSHGAPELLPHGEGIVRVSAKTGEGMDDLLALLRSLLDTGTRQVTLSVPYDQGGVLDLLYREAKVESVEYADTIRVSAVCTPKVLGRVRRYCDPPLPEAKEPWEG
ncbi:MAG: hypothetical protein LUE61_06430, partial [Clostridiales bacterium]|nr:hypothetical protein [Clostridiales bacterium]